MIPRTTKPESGNPYYNTKDAGGYSRAIKGSPTVAGLNVLRNCVGYAFGRFHEIAQRKEMDFFDPVNAENIFQNAIAHGMKTGQTPIAGAAIVWQKGATLSGSDGAGHIAIVEYVNKDGSIMCSESGWNSKSDFWCKVYDPPFFYATGYKLLGFIYQPGAAITKILRKGDKGAEVELMQLRLSERGYLRKNEIDGDFGKITLGAVLAFQFENKLQVDGVCGAETRKALFK